MAYDQAVDSKALDAVFTGIADAVRQVTGTTQPIAHTDLPQSISEVFEAGKQAEHDAFWEHYQRGGLRGDYAYAFSSVGWNDTSFRPIYPLTPTCAIQMFEYCGITDLKAALETAGITLDFTAVRPKTDFSTSYVFHLFRNSAITHFPKIDLSGAGCLTGVFAQCSKATQIDELVLSADNEFSDVFYRTVALEHIRISGVIGKNGLSFAHCTKLTAESLASILAALEDKRTDTSGTVWLLTLGNENIAKLTEAQKNAVYAKGWSLA